MQKSSSDRKQCLQSLAHLSSWRKADPYNPSHNRKPLQTLTPERQVSEKTKPHGEVSVCPDENNQTALKKG